MMLIPETEIDWAVTSMHSHGHSLWGSHELSVGLNSESLLGASALGARVVRPDRLSRRAAMRNRLDTFRGTGSLAQRCVFASNIAKLPAMLSNAQKAR